MIVSDSIGVRLKRARDERRLTISQVSAATRIRSHYLEALEMDDLSSLPSVVQARGFLRIYAEFLNLNMDEVGVVMHPPEPAAIPEPKVPSADVAVVPTEKKVSRESGQPNIFMRLGGRFKRPSDASSAANSVEGAKSVLAGELQSPSSVPEPFVPVRNKEELPPLIPPLADESTGGERPTIKRAGGRKTSASKTSKNISAALPAPESSSNILESGESGLVQDELKKKTF